MVILRLVILWGAAIMVAWCSVWLAVSVATGHVLLASIYGICLLANAVSFHTVRRVKP